MCKNCVVVESVSESGAVAHIGYDKSDKNAYEKLLTGDIVIQTKSKTKRLSQKDYLKLWGSLKEKDGFGVIDSNIPQK